MSGRMTTIERSTWATKVGLARMLAGGVIMDVVTADQARVAEAAGAVAVMALERVPSDIRKFGGVARMMMDQFFGCMVASLPTGREDVAAAAEAATDA